MKKMVLAILVVSLCLLPMLAQASESDVYLTMMGTTTIEGNGSSFIDGSGGIAAGTYARDGVTEVVAKGGMEGFTTATHHGVGTLDGYVSVGAYAEKTCHSAFAATGAIVSMNALAVNGIAVLNAAVNAGAIAY